MNSQMTQSPFGVNSPTSPCWFVGAMINRGDDQTDRFIDEGLWEHDFDDNSRVLSQVRSMQTGERIAIKAAYVKKHCLTIEPEEKL